MMQPADARQRDNLGFSVWPPVHRPLRGSRLPEPEVCSVVVVVSDVIAEEPTQMPLVEDDDVVEELAAHASHPALGDAVSARGCGMLSSPP